MANILASYYYVNLDLTEDKRYTLTASTYKLLDKVEDVLSVEVYLEGEFPSSIKHFQNRVEEILGQFRSHNANVKIRFIDPTLGNEEDVKSLMERFKNLRITPINLPISTKNSQERKLIFPVAILRYQERESVVRLLDQTDALGIDYTRKEAINRELNLLEYKFANGINRLLLNAKPRVALLGGYGSLDRPFTESLEKALYEYYDIGRFNIDSLVKLDTNIDAILVLKPTQALGEKNLFKLDQYIMNGGKVLWMVDMLNIEMDSIWGRNLYIPMEHQIDFPAMLFRYGVRINPNTILDWNSSPIPVFISKGQMELRNWFYHVLAFPYLTPKEAQNADGSTNQHPIVKNINYVDTRFPASIDTVQTKTDIKKTILLRSSQYSKTQFPPVRISMDILDAGLTPEGFEQAKQGYQNIAVLLEGEFESYFRNRVSPEMMEGLQRLGTPYREKSIKPGKMIVVSDGDIAANHLEPRTRRPLPLGANPFNGQMYGNRDFVMNCVEYLLDTENIIAARAKQSVIRPLDQERARAEALQWQFINLGLPLVILVLFGLAYAFWRKRRYAKD
jgi:gliding-associated putative ABC transporter substrate-binding component GldG